MRTFPVIVDEFDERGALVDVATAPIADYGALAGAGIRSWPRRAMRRRAGVEDAAAE
jgi:hypothetical protein